MFALPSSFLPSTVRPTIPVALDGLWQAWQQVHERLVQRSRQACTADELTSLAIYQCCAYRAFGHEQDAVLAQELLQRLIRDTPPATAGTAEFLEVACRLAWLQATPPGPTSLVPAGLDYHLAAEARHLRTQSGQSARRDFFRIIRYFSLRQLTPPPTPYLRQLVTQTPGLPDLVVPSGATQPLGLADGLTSELLLLLRVYNANLPLPELAQYVRDGIQYLLMLKRDVDFAEQRYSFFPYQVQGAPRQSGATFSPIFNLTHGDLGPALLLYTGQRILHEPELARLADLVGLNTLLRSAERSTCIASAPLLQGAAGVAHLYGKLYRVSGQPAYQRGQHFWLDQTQRWLHEQEHGPIITKSILPGDELRHGLVGVGLVLLSALVDTELSWELLVL